MKNIHYKILLIIQLVIICWLIPQAYYAVDSFNWNYTEELKERTKPVEVEFTTEIFEVITAEITAYCLTGIMASGLEVYSGAIACPRNIPLKTEIQIGGKMFICEDRMNLRFPDRFDIWMEDCDDCWDWGVRKLPVKIYNYEN